MEFKQCNVILLKYVFPAGANSEKPDLYFVLPCIGPLIIQILDEILNEPRIPDEKRLLVEKIKEAEGSPNWLHFCVDMSSALTEALLEKKKFFHRISSRKF